MRSFWHTQQPSVHCSGSRHRQGARGRACFWAPDLQRPLRTCQHVRAAPEGMSTSGLLDGVGATDEEMQQAGPTPAGTPALPKVLPVSSELRRKSWALKSVIKVFVTKVDPNYGQPWQMCPQRSSTGSAFVISHEKRQILTNSHVVCDLALLTVRDDSFWTPDLRALSFDDVPELQASISVAGYPVGGDSLSITKGIVSRLTLVRYSPAARLLSIQIDAAINPGNSGGPAFSDLEGGRVAGVAFSKNTSSTTDNIGFVIPYRVVQHFLDEYEQHGVFRGVPDAGFISQDMENPAQKAYLKVPPNATGVVVSRVDPLSAAAASIQLNDVLLEVEGDPVADDGTMVFRDDERLEYTHLIRSKHVGDPLHLTVLRDGQTMQVSYPLATKDHLVPLVHGVDCEPSYFIVGGLVFCPLTSPFLDIAFGGSKRLRRAEVPVPILNALTADKQTKGQQLIVLVQVLAHEINHGYKYCIVLCETFNGKQIHNLRHLAHMVDTCAEPFLNFGLEGGRLVTLSRDECTQHSPAILAVHAIPADRSDDLREPHVNDTFWQQATAQQPPQSTNNTNGITPNTTNGQAQQTAVASQHATSGAMALGLSTQPLSLTASQQSVSHEPSCSHTVE